MRISNLSSWRVGLVLVAMLICAFMAMSAAANTSTHRYIAEDSNPISYPVKSTAVIAIGDLLYWDETNDSVMPADSLADAGTEAQNKDGFADLFIGVALTASASGDTTRVSVGTCGVYDFPLESASQVQVGDYLTVAADADGCDGDAVETAAASTDAIGICWKEAATGSTKVKIRIYTLHGAGRTPAD